MPIYKVEIKKENPRRHVYAEGKFANWIVAFIYAVKLGRATSVMGFFWPKVRKES